MSMKTHQQRFTAVDSGANNVVFIRTHGVGESLIRSSLQLSFISLVGKLNPLNKVDLTNPELSIIIEIIKTVCCVSVLKDYMLFRKYNLQEVAKEPTNQSTGPQEATNQSTGPQEAANQSTGPQEATNQSPQEAANQSTGPQEATNQSTGPQEAANQSTGPQEATNQSTGPQEAANQTQEHGDGEKADGSAESHDVSAGNGTKEAELE
uniref:THUMP domain containing 1 n=1 Tax=Cyprinus carpio TaxID=7962 RepID=A0A8C2PWX3_CYPCA